MKHNRKPLPQLGRKLFVTDGGLETTLVFHDKIELPYFAAFTLVSSASGRQKLLDYFRCYADLARHHGLGLILESPTWRASPDWVARLSLTPADMEEVNRDCIRLLEQIREEYRATLAEIVISGNIGPRGDGYVPANKMTAAEAEEYHSKQIRILADTAAELVSAFTLNYVEEAIGISRAANRFGIPTVISFTVETDGKLPAGETLKEAIESVDAAVESAPAYYMINCAHPTHFASQLEANAGWAGRIRGIRANASRCSHAELNESSQLDEGNPNELGQQYAGLRALLPNLTVIGGCCGTDHRHVAAMCKALA